MVFGALGASNPDYVVTLNLANTPNLTSVTLQDATATLAVGANTLNVTGSAIAAIGLTAGHITIADGVINDSGGVTLAAGTDITGRGKLNVSGAYSGAGSLQASAGTLDVFGTVASGVVLSIAAASASDLKIEGTATSAAAIAINHANQTLEVGGSGALTISAAESITLGTIKLDGGTLTDALGITVASGALTGFGKVNANIPTSAGTITATGGTLELNGTVASTTGGLHIGSASGDRLKLDGVSIATSATFSGTAGRLELNAAGTLTLTNALTVGANRVELDGAGSTLTDLAGISLSTGGQIGGTGVVNGNISGAGTIEGSGGTLKISNNLTSSTLFLEVDNGASVLELDGTVTSSTSFTYLNTDSSFGGTLLLGNSTAMQSFEANGVIHGMHEATGTGVTPTDLLDLRPISFATIGSTDIVGGNTIEVWNVAHTRTLATFQLASAAASGTFVDWQSDGFGGTSLFLDDNPCYVAGTHILTATGERMVESLMRGDIVLALAGDELIAQPIKWIGQRRIDLTAHPRPATVAPVRIRRGSFVDNMPHSDLLVSPDHAIFVDGKLICARQLVNGTTIRQEQGLTSLEYFHVELDAHAILLAEGLPAESYLNTGNHGFFTNSGEPLVLHPDLTDEFGLPTREAGSCAPFVSDEAKCTASVAALSRARGCSGSAGAAVRHHHRSGSARRRQGPDTPARGTARMGGPASPAERVTEARLVSRAGSPTDVRPWLEDRRCLGRGRGADRAARCEQPAGSSGRPSGSVAGLVGGGEERHGAAPLDQRRAAVPPLPAFSGPSMLEVRLGGEMTYAVTAEPEAGAEREAA